MCTNKSKVWINDYPLMLLPKLLRKDRAGSLLLPEASTVQLRRARTWTRSGRTSALGFTFTVFFQAVRPSALPPSPFSVFFKAVRLSNHPPVSLVSLRFLDGRRGCDVAWPWITQWLVEGKR